jgi:hypothetical protein
MRCLAAAGCAWPRFGAASTSRSAIEKHLRIGQNAPNAAADATPEGGSSTA